MERFERLALAFDVASLGRRQIAERVGNGRTVVGHKVGLTSAAMQRQLGVDEPDFGHITDDMVFDGYEQEGWVRVQRYNDRPWMELVTLWRALNAHIAGVVGSMSPESLSRQRTRHNLDQVGWKTVPRDQRVTLEYFVRDYVAHMKHHLGQIP